jgi:protocatechuate 3,4-dioxygenase beta subunit
MATYNDVTDDGLTFSNITVTETNVGTTSPFIPQISDPSAIDGPEAGFYWAAFRALVYGPGSEQEISLSYTATADNPGEMIASFDSLYVVDLMIGLDIGLTAIEEVRDLNGSLLATQTYTLGGPFPGPVQLVQAQQAVNVTLTFTQTTGAVGAFIDTSKIQQTFGVVSTDQLCSIGDYVWLDLDGDGIQAPGGDPGIGGVTVNLMDASGTNILATTTTDDTGFYLFDNLLAGTYTIRFVGVDGLVFSPQDQGGNDAADSDADPTTGLTGPITLEAGDHVREVDAGLTPDGSGAGGTAALGDRVWVDTNGNGIQDGAETGLAGVTVNLLDSTGTTILDTRITDSVGQYAFTNLAAGTYLVQFVGPDGYIFTGTDVGGDDSADSDANAAGVTGPITLAAGQINATIDAGLVLRPPLTASIGNYVWYDCDRDGVQDTNESGLSGVTVNLLDQTGTTVLATTTTNASGFYEFTGLAAGTYQVYFGTKSGYVLTAANQGTDDTKDSDASTSTRLSGPIVLAAGENNATVDAGMVEYCPPTGSIGNFVWCDTDRDGKQDSGEGGISGVTVKLMNAAGTTVLATTTTSSSGFYQFTGLAAGTYQVYFGTKSGYVLTAANQGSDDSKDSDANTSTRLSGPIVLSAGQNNTTVDAGMYAQSSGGCDDDRDNDCGGGGHSGGGHGGCDDDRGNRVEGLTPGFWSTHFKAWDGASDTQYANLVNEGTLSSVDVLRALPNQGKSGPGGAVGVLLGDSNGNGVKDGAETTLFVSLAAAQKLIGAKDSCGDARQILMRQALAAQLNIYNGKEAAGGMTVGADLISKAVQWLKGDGVFIYSDGSSGDVDRVGSVGVLESGSSGTIDFNTSSNVFTSGALSSSKYAWTQDKSMGVGSFTADAEEIKNALQAFNEDKLITSADGTKIGWSGSGGAFTDVHTNDANGLWTVLRNHGVI